MELPLFGECHVWWMAGDLVSYERGVLSAAEQRHADNLTDRPARRVFCTSRVAQRLIVAEYLSVDPASVCIDRTCPECGAQHGRPSVLGGGFDYSVAHTTDWVVVAVVSDGLVGIDLEKRIALADADAVAPHVTTSPELDALRRLPERTRGDQFTRLWTRKEAASKVSGLGLALPFEHLDVRSDRGVLFGAESFEWPVILMHDLAAPDGHRAALATTAPLLRVSNRV